MAAMAMDNATGKRLLALIRDADYAHPGEEVANRLLFAGVTRDPARRILDAGCGGGGAAAWVQDQGYGRVTGLEIDAETARLARVRHPEVCVVEGDLQRAADAVAGPFGLIYAMTALYAVPDQAAAFAQLAAVAAPGGRAPPARVLGPTRPLRGRHPWAPESGVVAPPSARRPPGHPGRRRLGPPGAPRPRARVRALVRGPRAAHRSQEGRHRAGVRARLVRLRGHRISRHPRQRAERRPGRRSGARRSRAACGLRPRGAG